VIGVLTSAPQVFDPARPARFAIVALGMWVACFAPWIWLSPVAFRLERRFPLGTTTWKRNLAHLFGRSVLVCLLASPLMIGAAAVVWVAFGFRPWSPRSAWFWFGHVPAAAVCFWCSVAAGYFVRTRYELRAHERRAARLALEKAQLEAGLNQAQLEVLRAKLNPHFLFNSLQNISVLTGQNPELARQMLTRLGDLLHAVLRRDSGPESTLREELELTEAYVALEQLRFGDRLRVVFDVAADVQRALVPCFLLQPLIENAIVHGLRSVRRDGLISVSASRERAELMLCVTDNGVGLPTRSSTDLKVGVGLGSTGERLERMHPHRHAFSITSPPAGGVEVHIRLPFRVGDGMPANDDE
jgi:two-component sensor histidine kinase